MDKTIENVVGDSGSTASSLAGSNQSLIIEFGELVLGMFNPFEREWYFRLTNSELRYVRRNLDSIFNAEQMARADELINTLKRANGNNKSRDDVSLAARSFKHDMVNLFQTTNLFFDYKRKTPEAVKNDSFINARLAHLNNLRLIGTAMAYLATKDERFLASMPSFQIDYLARRYSTYRLRRSKASKPRIPTSNLVYTALYQIIKNAKSNFNIKYYEAGGYGVIEFQDRGIGILDRFGYPIPPNRLYEIFEGVSSKGENGGLGLQLSKRLMEISGGYIEVESSPRGTHTPWGSDNPVSGKYSTKTSKYEAIPKQKHNGSKFSLYFQLRSYSHAA